MSEARSSSALSEDQRPLSDVERVSHRTIELSSEAMEFMQLLRDEDFEGLSFSDQLITFSDLGKEVGEFTVSVSDSFYRGEPCFRVHALSHGTIDDIPCGTSVTAFVSKRLETLEQEHHDYVKLANHPIDRKITISRLNDAYIIDMSVKQGEETTRSSRTYSVQDMEGVIPEGSNLLLMRLLAKKGISSGEMTFLSLDSEVNLCHSSYRVLPGQKENIDGHELDVVCIERNLSMSPEDMMTWRSFLTCDGHLVKRLQVGSPVVMVIVTLPEAVENVEPEVKPVFPKKPLNWEEDMELRSKYQDRKDELVAGYSTYMHQNPELRNLVSDYVQFLLLRKPTDVLAFSADYFEVFGQTRSAAGICLNSQIPERHPEVKSNQNINFLSKVSYSD